MKMTKIAKEVLYKNDFFAKRYDKTCGAVYIAKYGNGLIKIGSTYRRTVLEKQRRQ